MHKYLIVFVNLCDDPVMPRNPAISASLNLPAGLSFDTSGNLYIADQGNNRVRILLTDGTIWTVAGNGNPAFTGDGGLAINA
jgi:hypothetical protein